MDWFSWSIFRNKWLWIGFLIGMVGIVEWRIGVRYNPYRWQGDKRFYLWDRDTLWALRPEIAVENNGKSFHTNSVGLRGTDEYEPVSEHDLRIVVLGDSRAYGISVGDDSTFSHCLQTALQERKIDAEIMNSGTPGYTIVQCRAKLEQLLSYKPQIAILTAGYNDRRYLLLTPPDSRQSFSRIALSREIVDFLQRSNLLYALSYEWGKRQIRQIQSNPPPLDQVEMRVPLETFKNELSDFITQCRQNRIHPILMAIDQNPCVFEISDRAARFYTEKKYREAIDLLEKHMSHMHIAASSFSHYLLGNCYRELGNQSQANRFYATHEPIGSLHGEAVICEQDAYFQAIQDIALRENVPVIRSKDAIQKINTRFLDSDLLALLDRMEQENWNLIDGSPYLPRIDGKVTDLDNFFRGHFVDECHYDEVGHFLMGMELADRIIQSAVISLSPSGIGNGNPKS